MGLSFIVVSDLHVGRGARSRDLDPLDDGKGVRDEKFIERFAKFCADESISANYLIVPGDITDRATPDEFQLASEKVRAIASAVGVQNSNILFVPGNHDVDWGVISATPSDRSGFRFKQRYQPLCQPDCIFSEILGRKDWGELTDTPYFAVWKYADALILGHNTALHDRPEEHVHHGLVPQESLSALDAALSRYQHQDSTVRIALVHHHPLQYSDPVPNEPDFSAMTNAEGLLKVLAKHKFDLVVHGHKHKPNFNVHLVDSYFALPVLGAGSFSYQLDSRWSGLVNNQFHRVEIHDREPHTGRARGVLHSYTYLCGHGWQRSRPNNGIEHTIHFGGFAAEKSLESLLRTLIDSALQSSDYVAWHDVAKADSNLSYVPRKLLVSVLKKLQQELRYVLFDADPENMLLLRESRSCS